MAFYRSKTLQSFMNEDKNTATPHHYPSLQTYPRMPKSEPHISLPIFSSPSQMTTGLESPWTHTPLHLSPSPTLLYQCIASLHRNEGNIFSIAVLQGNVFTGSQSSRIRVWKQPDFVERGYLKTSSGEVRAMLAYGNMLFTTHYDKKVRVWNVTSSSSNDFLPRKLMMLSRSNALHSLRFFSWRKKLDKDYISCLAYYHAEGLLYTGSSEKTVTAWRVSDQRCIDSFVAHNDAVKAIVVNQDDGCVFTCSSDGTIKIWRRVHGETSHTLTMTLKFQLSPVNALALSFSLNACHLYSASSDGFINFWVKVTVSGRFSHGGFLQGHQNSVLCLVAKERLIFSGSEDATIRIWRREEGGSFHQCLTVLNGHTDAVQCLAACLEMEKVAMEFLVLGASIDGTLKVWRVKILPEQNNVCEDECVKCDHSSTPLEYKMSPVLSPSWVEKKLQGSYTI